MVTPRLADVLDDQAAKRLLHVLHVLQDLGIELPMDVAARLAVNLHLQLDFPTAPLPQLEEFLENAQNLHREKMKTAKALQECQKLAAEVVEAKHSGAMAVATALDQLAKAASAIQELRNEIVHLKLSKEELVKNYEAQVALTQGQLELPAGRIAERKASTNVSAQGHIDSSALISECNFHSTIDVNDEIKGSIPVNQQPAAAKPLGPRRSLLDQFDTATPEPTLSVPSMLTALSMSAPARLHLHGTLQELAASDSGVLGAKQIVDLPSKFKPVRDVSHGALHARSVTAALVRPSPASVLLDTQHSSGDSPEDPNPAEQVLHTNPLSESGDVITCTRTPADDGLTYGAKVEVAACDAKGTFPTGPVEVSPSLLEDPMSASPRTFANHITSAITAAEQALIRSYERSRRIEEDIKRRAAKQRGPVEVSPSLLVETPPDGVAAVTPASGPVKPVRTSIFTIPVEELFMKQEATSLEAPVRTSMATSVVESSAAAKKAPVRTSTFKLPMEQVPRRQQEDIPFEDAPLEREEEGLTSQDLKLGCCMLNCQVQPLLLEQVAHPTEPLRQAPEQQQNQEQEQEQVKLCINEVPSPGAHVQSLPVFHTSNDGLMAETDSEDDISAAAAFAALHTADPHGIRPEFIAARQIELDYQSMATLESAALQMEDAEAEGIALAVAHATQDSPPARIRLRAEADVLIKSAFKVVNGDEEDVQGVEVASLQAALQAADAMAALKMELDAHSQDWAVRCSMNSNGRTQLGKDSALRSSMPCNDEEQLAQAALEGVSSGPKLPAAKLADDEVFMNEFRACRAYAKARAVATIISRLEQEDAIAAVAVAKAAAAAAAIDGAGKEEDLLGAYYPQAGVTGEVLLGGNHQHTAVFSAACNEEEVFWGPEDEVTPVKAPPAAVTAAPLAPATPYVPASDGKSGGKKRRWGALLKRKLAKVFCFRV